jgi:3',5'-cyclic AMP phosphodiesterase CpdA
MQPTTVPLGERPLYEQRKRRGFLNTPARLCLTVFFLMIAAGCGKRTSGSAASSETDENAGLTFVQWSDPHLFDGGASRRGEGIEEEKLDNWSALHWAVLQTNRLVIEDHRRVDFVVLTGDFGLYNVKMPDFKNKNGAIEDDGRCVRDPKEGPGPAIPFDEAVRLVAQELRALLVKKVYIVPGNNDLCDEDPRDRSRYATFVLALQRTMLEQQKERKNDLNAAAKRVMEEQKRTQAKNSQSNLPGDPPPQPEVVDLTFTLEDLLQGQLRGAGTAPLDNFLSKEEKARYQQSRPSAQRQCSSNSADDFPMVNGFCLLGLDSSYFKAHVDPRSVAKKIQEAADTASIDAMDRLTAEVKSGGIYLLFTHIPDIEDPFPGRKSDPGSSWLLPSSAREKWKYILNREEVIAVFAGHFHSRDRKIYPHNFSYVKSLDPVVAQKFWLAPSLAAKYQSEPPESETARGIVLFQVNRKVVAAKTQPPESLVRGLPIWFSPLDPNPTLSLEFFRQLKLGEIYEQAGRRGDAESAYRKALDAANGAERDLALHHLDTVVNGWGFYELWMQKRRGLVGGVASLLIVSFLILVVWIFWRRTQRLQIYPLEVPNDAKIPAAHLEQVTEYLVGVMRYHDAKTGPIGVSKLPFIWSGFSKDLGAALEKLIPGKSSGVISWLLGWLFRPTFILRGTLALAASNFHIVLTLSRRGGAVRSWEKSAPLDQAHDTLKDMVYAVLLHIKRESG